VSRVTITYTRSTRHTKIEIDNEVQQKVIGYNLTQHHRSGPPRFSITQHGPLDTNNEFVEVTRTFTPSTIDFICI
jgi:hypothetical protein